MDPRRELKSVEILVGRDSCGLGNVEDGVDGVDTEVPWGTTLKGMKMPSGVMIGLPTGVFGGKLYVR